MKPGHRIVHLAENHPWWFIVVTALVTGTLVVLAALPSLWPERFPMLYPVAVDTDPENMLADDEPVRLFHDEMKHALGLYDMIVVGVVNDAHPEGVFNPQTLANIYELTEFAKTLRGQALGVDDPRAGVVEIDLIAPSTVDNIEPGGPGVVKFEWLMPEPPETSAEALALRDKAQRIPFLNGTLVSEDGLAIALYLPLTSKTLSYRVYTRLNEKIASFEGTEEYHITGLPVAEDVFGVEMFIQMAISAPLAMLVIFLLMLYFFRNLLLIIPPIILAMVSVMITMGLLVVTGNTIHIMSSMIPIFIMPIAVLDSIHILSDFFDRYAETRDRRKTLDHVMDTLFAPMLYTSLTSAAGFASLSLTPIPPVQVFGIFVAIGVLLAWILTITLIPVAIVLIPERRLERLGSMRKETDEDSSALRRGPMGRFLHGLNVLTRTQSKPILAAALVLVFIAGYGISQIEINDNPTKWFKSSHPIRVADTVLNQHFGGTYMAYLALGPVDEPTPRVAAPPAADAAEQPATPARPSRPEPDDGGPALPEGLGLDDGPALPEGLGDSDGPALPAGLGGPDTAGPAEPSAPAVGELEPLPEIFKQPEVLEYIERLQEHLLTIGVVGKSNSLADIVKTVHRELFDGEPEQFRVPGSPQAVAQTLMQYQSSHRPQDLWHFVTPDYRHTSLWLQLTSGDNRDMTAVAEAVEAYIAANPLPAGLEARWFGLTYINVVWQQKMVSGMLQAFAGSFLVVFLMMNVLFHSAMWSLLCMIPLSLTIALSYGIIGLIGKPYDMPVAVLSSLTLGLAVDFAIHLLARGRTHYVENGCVWPKTREYLFGEPARAITRNVIVLAVGFLPLLAAPLVPYITVGVFLASILFVSGVATLVLLPTLMAALERVLFPRTAALAFTCKCGTCIMASAAAVALLAVNLHQFLRTGWSGLTWTSALAIIALASACWLLSRRESCRVAVDPEPADAGTPPEN